MCWLPCKWVSNVRSFIIRINLKLSPQFKNLIQNIWRWLLNLSFCIWVFYIPNIFKLTVFQDIVAVDQITWCCSHNRLFFSIFDLFLYTSLYQSWQAHFFWLIDKNLQVPKVLQVQTQWFVEYVQTFNNYMFNCLFYTNLVLDWVFECMIKWRELYWKRFALL